MTYAGWKVIRLTNKNNLMQAKGFEVRIYTPNIDITIVVQDEDDIPILTAVLNSIENKVLKILEVERNLKTNEPN